MESELLRVKEILKKYNQEHCLNFYDELSNDQKEMLISQLSEIDFEKINNLYNDLKTISIPSDELIEPLDYFVKNDINIKERRLLENEGTSILKLGHYAVLTMAGGQGTRLGHKGPKGTFELNLSPKKSLFEILADKIKQSNKRFGITIPWYIMTSDNNNEDTINFFEAKNYFGINKNNVHFFVQNKLPLVSSSDGKVLLSELYQVYEASNGNGNLFESLKSNGFIEKMKNDGIEWVFVSGIDNILVKVADPLFLALTINNHTEIGAKTIFKANPFSHDWVFCRKNGKPAMLGYQRITDEITNACFNNKFLYREVNILCHLFSMSAIEKIADIDLPYHIACKKNYFINNEGMKVLPDSPNSYKFEKFIFDSFKFFDNITLLRVDENKEFAPIKDPVRYL